MVHYGVLKRLSKIHYFDLPTHLATSKNVPLLSKGEYDELKSQSVAPIKSFKLISGRNIKKKTHYVTSYDLHHQNN